jgi:hypothetical protein
MKVKEPPINPKRFSLTVCEKIEIENSFYSLFSKVKTNPLFRSRETARNLFAGIIKESNTD